MGSRVVLVEPAFPAEGALPVQQESEPYGLMMLLAALKAARFEVAVHRQGAGLPDAALATTILRGAPDAIGLSLYALNSARGLALARALRAAGFRGPVVLGGPHATVRPDLVLDDAVDALLCGEGEIAAPALFRALEAGTDPAGLPGVAVARDGRVLEAPFELVEDLSSLPWADRSIGGASREYSLGAFGLEKSVLMTARGCRHACAFCAARYLSRGRVRFRAPDEVVEEIAFLVRHHGRRFLSIMDDDFFADVEHVTRFCEAKLAAGLDIPFSCMGRLDAGPGLDLKLLARAGCRRIYFGIERAPGSTRFVRKCGDADTVNAGLRRFADAGIFTMAGFLVGLPDEDEPSLAAMRAFMLRMEADYVGSTIFAAHPRTALYEHLVREGADVDPAPNMSLPTRGRRYGGVEAGRLEAWRLETLRRFYVSPRYARRVARRIAARPGLLLDYGRLLGKGVLDGLLGFRWPTSSLRRAGEPAPIRRRGR